MIKAAIFDMDGVIAHTNPFHSIAFKKFFALREVFPTEEEFKEHMYGKTNSYILSHFLARKIEGEELRELEFEKESLFREIYAKDIAPVNGLIAFLKALNSSKVDLAVATSAPRANLNLILNGVGIQDWFKSKLSEEDVTEHKPNPEVYLKTAEKLGLDPSSCVVFEDSFSGATAALSAGMFTVGVLTSHTPDELPDCHLFIKDFTEVSLEKLNKL